MLKKMLVALSCVCVTNIVYGQNVAIDITPREQNAVTYNCAYDAYGRVIYSAAWEKAYEAQWQALDAYEKARATTDKQVANAKYTEAIKQINLALVIAPENAEYQLLASQIYRSRGGLSYARNYFSKACALYEQQLKEYPESITLNLQYAIACYAGDARYYPDYNEYKIRSYVYANQTLKLIEKYEAQFGEKQILLPKLLAYVLLQDYAQAEKTAKRINYVCDKNLLAYASAEQYQQLVANGQWLWRVSSKANAEKDFLLYSINEWGI